MPVTMSGSPKSKSPSPEKASADPKSKKFGGDRSKPTVYKGPSKKTDSRYQTGPILADEVAGGGWGASGKPSTGADEVLDKRSDFEKAFDDKQAEWQNNDDRNDDALYHRSFDDNSMHLKSSAFRDGKPVDNHAKEVGGMGAKAITKYRRHDMQASVVEGESAYAAPPASAARAPLRQRAARASRTHSIAVAC